MKSTMFLSNKIEPWVGNQKALVPWLWPKRKPALHLAVSVYVKYSWPDLTIIEMLIHIMPHNVFLLLLKVVIVTLYLIQSSIKLFPPPLSYLILFAEFYLKKINVELVSYSINYNLCHIVIGPLHYTCVLVSAGIELKFLPSSLYSALFQI